MPSSILEISTSPSTSYVPSVSEGLSTLKGPTENMNVLKEYESELKKTIIKLDANKGRRSIKKRSDIQLNWDVSDKGAENDKLKLTKKEQDLLKNYTIERVTKNCIAYKNCYVEVKVIFIKQYDWKDIIREAFRTLQAAPSFDMVFKKGRHSDVISVKRVNKKEFKVKIFFRKKYLREQIDLIFNKNLLN